MKTPLEPRKSPRQARAKATVEAILDATARILVDQGIEKLSTNRVAQVAGVSIGSLYQYFPNKEALVLALLERHVEKMLGLLSRSASTLVDAPVEEAVRAHIRAMLDAHAIHPRLHHMLTLQALQLDLEALRQWEQRARLMVRGYLERRRDEILPDDLDMAAFVLVSAVEAVVHRALMHEDPQQIPWARLERELTALVRRYLLGAHG